jgi:hypothetical protein
MGRRPPSGAPVDHPILRCGWIGGKRQARSRQWQFVDLDALERAQWCERR